ncbi:hypothetical protein DGG96_12010 [Legionella qingyii]|uniref:Prepilin-type N-terminal cleavage/methylation domain-containing protein n=1 Tax=Legionella qingyii TaxID=2184757 RepID=A0A317U4Q2_9GAMM|nr:prepilin-type N-terminal cleavage/methylation domain-containing protein [Legionella qingyii]PWY55350.1 hypothetical protein DGG96_12010 [Legionella qingyii]RUR21250.1 hypothetical protein ELY20_13165 [Legionella qingyii]RUR23959.1 hypothetical protein ELY16_12150 [Legionella qingyii]
MRRTSGFTLIELIVIILIVTLMAVYYGIKTPSVSLYSLSSITEQLRRDIRYTQTLASSLNTNYSIILSTNSYTISPNPPNGAYSVSMPTGITLSSVSITFNSMGAPESGAIITITASGVGTSTLTVSAETGFVNG